MNQTTNLTQWKNLTDEQKAEHDFDNYKYQVQNSFEGTKFAPFATGGAFPNGVYRLKIEPEKWYFCALDYTNVAGLKLGKDISTKYDTLRPAKPSEIPKPKRVFKDGAFYPVIFTERHRRADTIVTFDAMRSFSPTGACNYFSEDQFDWIGEELNIKWGES